MAGAQAAPVGYIAQVHAAGGRCVFQTGDVPFDRRQFEADLRARFDRAKGILIYRTNGTPGRCVRAAISAARHVGFVRVESADAPADLDMGPPRTGP